jgi:DNA-directed RNA polymerase specialized sigma24 family protein
VAVNVAWTLTQPSFDALLARLDADRERAGLAYEEIRKRLVRYFEWQSSRAPEDHADTVLSRLARKIEQGEEIENVHRYAVGVARLVAKEVAAEQGRRHAILAQHEALDRAAITPEKDQPDDRVSCLDTCLKQLPASSRDLLLEYYEHEGRTKIDHRDSMARHRGISGLALRGRVHRVKASLEECVFRCLDTAARPSHF